uniref:Uncharacterized protein n=1 Tax=Cacopsylla melanoneura TaxID=428564 RepID=A0A8D9BQM0_9HEMI
MRALYRLAMASQSAMFSIRVAELVKLNWDPRGDRCITLSVTDSLGATCPFLTLANHLAPILVLALARDLDCSPISLTRLGLLLDWFIFCLHSWIRYMSHEVTKFSGDGVVVVRCMFRINLASPYFHSMSDWAWIL